MRHFFFKSMSRQINAVKWIKCKCSGKSCADKSMSCVKSVIEHESWIFLSEARGKIQFPRHQTLLLITSQFPLHNCRPSCLRQGRWDPKRPGCSECTPEKQHFVNICWRENISPAAVPLSPPVRTVAWTTASKGWLQTSGSVGGTWSFPSCFPTDTLGEKKCTSSWKNLCKD